MSKYTSMRVFDNKLIEELNLLLANSEPDFKEVAYGAAEFERKGKKRYAPDYRCEVVEYESKAFEYEGRSYVNRSIGIENIYGRSIDSLSYDSEWYLVEDGADG